MLNEEIWLYIMEFIAGGDAIDRAMLIGAFRGTCRTFAIYGNAFSCRTSVSVTSDNIRGLNLGFYEGRVLVNDRFAVTPRVPHPLAAAFQNPRASFSLSIRLGADEATNRATMRELALIGPRMHTLKLGTVNNGNRGLFLRALEACTGIRKLTLSEAPGLNSLQLEAIVQAMPTLRSLDIENADNLGSVPISVFGTKDFGILQLDVRNCPLFNLHTPPGWAEGTVPLIEKIGIFNCGVFNAAGFSTLVACTGLSLLDIKDCNGLGAVPISPLCASAKKLKRLYVADCNNFDVVTAVLPPDAYVKTKRLVFVRCPRLGDDGIRNGVLPANPEELVLAELPEATYVSLDDIFSMRELKELHIIDTSHWIAGGNLTYGISAPALSILAVSSCIGFTGNVLLRIVHTCPNITSLSLAQCRDLHGERLAETAKGLKKLERFEYVNNGAGDMGRTTSDMVCAFIIAAPRLTHMTLDFSGVGIAPQNPEHPALLPVIDEAVARCIAKKSRKLRTLYLGRGHAIPRHIARELLRVIPTLDDVSQYALDPTWSPGM
jgi:hypothetical protein